VCAVDSSGAGVVGGEMVLTGPGKPVELNESFLMPIQPKETQQQTTTTG
jgi:hypothetical protein